MCQEEKDVQMDESGRTALTSDSGPIGDDYVFEETVNVSTDEEIAPDK